MISSDDGELVSIADASWQAGVCGALDALRRAGDAAADFCDVTLVGDDGACVRAHTCMLAAASPYLREMLAGSGGECTLRLEAVSERSVNAVVRFVYDGAVSVPACDVRDVAAAARQLGVDRLVELVEQAIAGGGDDAAMTDDDAGATRDGVSPTQDVGVTEGMQHGDAVADDDDVTNATRDALETDPIDVTSLDSPANDAHVTDSLHDAQHSVAYDEPTHDTVTQDTLTHDVHDTRATTATHDADDTFPKHIAADDGDSNYATFDAVITTSQPLTTNDASAHVTLESGLTPNETRQPASTSVDASLADVSDRSSDDGSIAQQILTMTGPMVEVTEMVEPDEKTDEGQLSQCLELIDGADGQPIYVMLSLAGDATTVGPAPAPVPGVGVAAAAVGPTPRGGRDAAGLFACTECPKTFKKRVYLEEHRRAHTGDLYTCAVCAKRFQWKRGLELHARTHTGEKPYACAVCGQRFAHSSNYSAHVLRHTHARPFACSVCDERFGSKSSMVRHRRTHAAARAAHACDVCARTFTERHLLMKHARAHTGERAYACDACPRRFTHASSLAYHRWTHRAERPLACDQCGVGCVTRAQLTAHMRTHTGERPYACARCERRFGSAANLAAHARTHTGERPFACLACARAFATSSNLRRHHDWHARQAAAEVAAAAEDTDERPHQCSVCGKRFCRRSMLIRHEKCHSTGADTFRCTGCDAVFTRACNLRRHEQTAGHDVTPTDAGDPARRLACDACDATFAHAGALETHARAHTFQTEMCAVEGRPHACTECPRRFKSLATLRQHGKTHVTWVCGLCQQTFGRQRQLVKHTTAAHPAVTSPLSAVTSPPAVTSPATDVTTG